MSDNKSTDDGSRIIVIIGIVLAVLALILAVVGIALSYETFDVVVLVRDLWDGLAMELASIALTILLIDVLYERKQAQAEVRRERAQLVNQLGSSVAHESRRAAEQIRANNWLADGLLIGAYLGEVSLPSVNLSGADLRNATLSGADLNGANLRGANLEGAKLTGTNLQGAQLNGANLTRATLVDANLDHATLTDANLSDARMTGANLTEATLAGCVLSGADGLTDAQFASVYMLMHATLPDGSRYDNRFNLQGDSATARRTEGPSANRE